MANGNFDSLMNGCGLKEGGSHNASNSLPGGAKADMTLPDIGLISAGYPTPSASAAQILDAGMANFGLTPSSGKGTLGAGASNLLDSPFETPLKAKN